jgi:hypothetical protein
VPDSSHGEVEVLAGTHGRLRWQVWTGGNRDDLMTMLQVFDGDGRVAWSGFGGPALYPGGESTSGAAVPTPFRTS